MMKYFARQVWEGWQGDDRDQWIALCKKNLRNYRRQLERLKPRLNQRTFDFFAKDSLHDGFLVSLNITDREVEIELAGGAPRNRRYPTTVTMSVAHSDDKHIYTLSYSRARRIELVHPPERDLFRGRQEGFRWWVYDELTSKDKSFLAHDILFDSGATISLEFKSISVRRKRI